MISAWIFIAILSFCVLGIFLIVADIWRQLKVMNKAEKEYLDELKKLKKDESPADIYNKGNRCVS